ELPARARLSRTHLWAAVDALTNAVGASRSSPIPRWPPIVFMSPVGVHPACDAPILPAPQCAAEQSQLVTSSRGHLHAILSPDKCREICESVVLNDLASSASKQYAIRVDRYTLIGMGLIALHP